MKNLSESNSNNKAPLPKGYSLYVRILTAFIALISITVLPIVIYGYYIDSYIMLTMADNLIDQVTKTAIDKSIDYLKPLSRIVEISSNMAEVGVISSTDNSRLERYTLEILKYNPHTSMFYVGDEHGNFLMARRLQDGTIATNIVNRKTSPPSEIWKYRNAAFNVVKTVKATTVDYDPRPRPWYAGAKQAKSVHWTDVYVFFHGGKEGITAASPIISPSGKVLGVFGLDIDLDEISHFLNNLKVGKHGLAFIFNEKNELVAYPDVSLTTREENGQLRPVLVEELGIASITSAFRKCQQKGKNKCVVESGGKKYLASFQDFPATFRARWKVGVIAPEDDFIAGAKEEMRDSLLIFAVILIISISLAMLVSRGISKPIKLLTREANRIKNFHLDDKITIKSYIREIQVMGNAIAAMKSGLQAFRRYVPAELVRQLISTGEEARLGGHKRELTVFFSDIAGFTTIAEGMAAEELMLHLSEYFDELTQILADQHGTVDKYIGDGIMAFWGAPVPDDNHALHACNAALICQAKLKDLNRKWAAAGKSPLATRIGISTGETVVGNVGSSERINYTVIGDNVNLASRLEGVNKLYSTQIIVSLATYKAVADKFWFRPLDIVAVKGRSEGTTIYELIMKKGEGDTDQVAELCVEFAKGFETYLARDWQAGIKIFQNLSSKFPNDIPADLYLTRCRHYLSNPPEADWQGIAYLETK